MNFADRFSLSLHRAVAEKMRVNEDEVLRIARANLERWLKSESFTGGERSALLEWLDILETSRPDEIHRELLWDRSRASRADPTPNGLERSPVSIQEPSQTRFARAQHRFCVPT